MELDRDDRRRDLEQFSNAAAQGNQPHGHSLVRPTSGLAERVVGMQPVAIRRDNERIMQEIKEIAAMAGDDWFYRFPIRSAGGGQDWVEGCSIKLANNVARIYGNNINEIRETDVGDAWVFYARFTDIEKGFTMERAFHQRKSQTAMKTKDRDRQIDIAYQIGQSKAIRNCIVNALDVYCNFALQEARKSIVKEIGKDLPMWIERTIEAIKGLPVEIKRVERVVGRVSKDWLAPDIARIRAQVHAVRDGMTTIDEAFPPDQEVLVDQASKPGAQSESGTQNESSALDPGQAAAETQAVDTSEVDTSESVYGANGGLFVDPVRAANERGRSDRAAGHQRRAVPGEYRTKPALVAAWQQGWDSQGE
jgi:hypothetical protein